MIGVVAAVLAAYGTFLVWSGTALGWSGFGFGPRRQPRRLPLAARLRAAGLEGVRLTQLATMAGTAALLGGAGGYVLFGGLFPPLVCGLFAAGFPVASLRARRGARVTAAREAWPRMLEELRLLTGSLGRSIPQALFEVGRRAPAELQQGFRRAEREWLLTTDFGRTLDLLKAELADPTADAVCETLLVAHEVGGGALDRRLAALIDDRLEDLTARKDARAKQAGVKFARLFVLVVPLGMAVAGLSIGNGRAAYRSAGGQLAVAIGLVCIAACWVWSGRLLRLPAPPRVFAGPATGAAVSGRTTPSALEGEVG